MKEYFINKMGTVSKNIFCRRWGLLGFKIHNLVYKLYPFLGINYGKGFENDFVLGILKKSRKGTRILDAGCWGSFLPYKFSDMELDTYAVDAQDCSSQYKGTDIKFLKVDLMNLPFKDSFFDFITCISVIEHVGLGFYNDQVKERGDIKAMQEFLRLLKSDGFLIITTLVGPEFKIINNMQRIYDQKEYYNLFNGYEIKKEIFGDYVNNHWIEVDSSYAFSKNTVALGFRLGMIVASINNPLNS